MKPFTMMTMVFLGLIAFAHLLRVILGWEIVVDAIVIPMWPSVLVFLFFGWLVVGLWREAKREG